MEATKEAGTSKRIAFTFDPNGFKALQEITEDLEFVRYGDSVREALSVLRSLIKQAEDGYSEVIVRNPDNKKERLLVIQSVIDAARNKK